MPESEANPVGTPPIVNMIKTALSELNPELLKYEGQEEIRRRRDQTRKSANEVLALARMYKEALRQMNPTLFKPRQG